MKISKFIVPVALTLSGFILINPSAKSESYNPMGPGYHQRHNPMGQGYIQDHNPMGHGYVQDKSDFGF